MTEFNKTLRRSSLGLLGVAILAALSGCGGSSLSKSAAAPSPYSDPTVQGLAPGYAAYVGNIQGFEETSGFGSPDNVTGYATAAVDSDSVAIPGIAISTSPTNPSIKTTPLGFAPGGQYFNNTANGPLGAAVNPGASVIFRASIATGVDPTNNTTPPIVPSSVRITSTEAAWTSVPGLISGDPNAPNGYLHLGLNVQTSGPLANGTYVTGTPDASGNVATPTAFPLPFTTTGLHTVRVFVADTRAVVHHTDFQVVVVAPTDSAIIVQALDATGSPVTGAKITLDSGKITPTAPAVDQTTTDVLTGVGIIFATPAKHTITITGTDSKGNTISGTDTEDLTSYAGKLFNSTLDSTGAATTTPYSITLAAAAASAIRSHVVSHH